MEFISENRLFFFLLGFSLIGFFVAGWFIFDLRKKVMMLFGGRGRDQSDVTKNMVRRLYEAEERISSLEPRVHAAEAISKMSVYKVGFLRFNPFQDTGGDNSFVATFLDHGNNGIIITSLYTREGVRVYGKNVVRGASKYPLTEEEKRVMEETMQKSEAQN